MSLTYETTLEKFDSNMWGYHFPIAEDVADNFIDGNDRRVLCSINGGELLHVSLMPNKGQYFILINKNLTEKLRLSNGQKVSLTLEKDTSEYGMDMPEELRELLYQDESGSKYFHALTPGKQRSLIYLVSKVKNTNSRLNKALAIVHHLNEMNGKLDFKILNETIKYYNNL